MESQNFNYSLAFIELKTSLLRKQNLNMSGKYPMCLLPENLNKEDK
jgi:hypothetical protein